LPLFYVIEGRDALEPSVVAAAVGRIPATDPATVEPAPDDDPPLPLLGAVVAVVLGLLATLRRTERL
jgi:MYXO-CTERM domain-containing protein